MSTKKHYLTVGDDKIKGTSGKDLFIAGRINENLELNPTDRLDGGGGLDTIRAEIGGMTGAPVMKGIETGLFKVVSQTGEIDLKGAPQMRAITIQTLADPNGQTLIIDNAKSVQAISIAGGVLKDDHEVSGLDSKAHKSLSLMLSDTMAQLGTFTVSGKPFKQVEITLGDTLNATLWGGAISARDVTIHSLGEENSLSYAPGQYTGTTRHLTIDGRADLTLSSVSGNHIFDHLFSLDLTGMQGSSDLAIGGEKLTSIRGGAGREFLTILDLGGTKAHKAMVSLGADFDSVSIGQGQFDAETQRFDGGKGSMDSFAVTGGADDLWKAIKNFERVFFYSAIGTYDLNGQNLEIYINGTSGAVTLDRVKSGALITPQGDFATFLTIKVENAVASQNESAVVDLTTSISIYGNSVVGLIAPSLSELEIRSSGHAHLFSLTTIGSATDNATLAISGDEQLILRATTGSTSYIDRITITNTGGVDLSGLENGTRALVGTGATVTGGAGDDVLIGSIGADVISTGGGDNTVLGSLNADKITLGDDSGLDMIVYRANGESSYGLGFDTIANFGIFDAIDVSDFADVTFVGNFADNASGIAALSTSQQRAFFNTTTDTLYIDIDHDKALGLNHDMQIVLTGLASFASPNLIS